jgi:hypothetical protein
MIGGPTVRGKLPRNMSCPAAATSVAVSRPITNKHGTDPSDPGRLNREQANLVYP